MLSLLCVDSNTIRLRQLCTDLNPLKDRLNVFCVTSLHEATTILFDEKNSISAILCAHELSDGSALQLFKKIRHQLVRKILYSENPTAEHLTEYINDAHINHFLSFPYQKKDLINTIKTQFKKYKVKSYQLELYKEKKNTIALKGDTTPSVDFKDRFLDYSLYSDSELSALVINSLYKLFEKNDEHQIKRKYSAHHILTKESEHNKFLWFITKGEVLLRKNNSLGEPQDITTMQAGSMVGSMSFMTGEPAFSSGITLVETEVFKVSNVIFSQILQSNTQLIAPFTNLLLRNFNRRLQHSISIELTLKETMLSLEEAYTQLIESEKMAVLGNLVAGVAHELNNPISAIIRNSDTLITLVTDLLFRVSNTPFSLLIQQVLTQSLTVIPLSTLQIRNDTKIALKQINDKKRAKKLATMRLDISSIPLTENRKIYESIDLLFQYHQVGTFLRSNNVCATRIADLVKSLKHYSGQDNHKVAKTDIHEGIEETLIIFENRLKNIELQKEYQSLPEIDCHPIELQQVWTNIIANALDAISTMMPAKIEPALSVKTQCLIQNNNECIQVIFTDNGPGIPADKIKNIFELNYTTKREGNFGLGIGLTICDQIIKRHHGTIEIESEVGIFTRFIITLPIQNLNIESDSAEVSL